jgi:peptidoglycan/xylan/chitin deacetylase (PgdA/CDA1 family)
MARFARTAILGCAIVAPIITLLVIRQHAAAALGLLFCSHLLLLYPTLVANAQGWGPVITAFETSRREVWLTIDDGPDELHTRKILELLDRFGAKATFFVIGERLARNHSLGEEAQARGHELANHTFTHPSGSFWCAGPKRIALEIDRCTDELRAVRATSRYFRAPAGLKIFLLHPLLARRDFLLIGWTVRGLDTISDDAEVVAARILKKVRPGAIILLHEGHRTATDPEFHLHCLERTLTALREMNYACVLPTSEQLRSGFSGKQTGDC